MTIDNTATNTVHSALTVFGQPARLMSLPLPPPARRRSSRSREDYIAAFRQKLVTAVRNGLETGRLLYEARKSLDQLEFKALCRQIGIGSPTSRKIRDLIELGADYPRLVKLLRDREFIEDLRWELPSLRLYVA